MKAKVEDLQVPSMAAREGENVDWSRAAKVSLPNLKLSTETISLRMPSGLLHRIKREAHRRDVPYQSLIKMALAEHFLTTHNDSK